MIFNRVWLSGHAIYRPTDYEGWDVCPDQFKCPKYTVMLAVL